MLYALLIFLGVSPYLNLKFNALICHQKVYSILGFDPREESNLIG